MIKLCWKSQIVHSVFAAGCTGGQTQIDPKLKSVYWIINETFVHICFSKTQYCVKWSIKHLSPASQPYYLIFWGGLWSLVFITFNWLYFQYSEPQPFLIVTCCWVILGLSVCWFVIVYLDNSGGDWAEDLQSSCVWTERTGATRGWIA